MADLNVRLVTLSLVDFAIANPSSTRADAGAHLQTAHGWQQIANALNFVVQIELRLFDSGKTAAANWASVRNVWNADGAPASKQWVRTYLDTPQFRALPGVQLPLLKEQRVALNTPIVDQNAIIAAAQALVDSLTGLDQTVAQLGRESARNTRDTFLRARDALDAQIAALEALP